MTGLAASLGFAFGAGVLATVNPCGFAMLPAFLAYNLGGPSATGPASARLRRGFGVGCLVSVGFTGVFTGAGLLVALGLRQLMAAAPWVAVVIGALLVAGGTAGLVGWRIEWRLGSHPDPGRRRGARAAVGFGAAYAVASLSCTLPVLLALVAQATATANPGQTLAVFAAYAIGAATILVGVAVGAGLLGATLTRLVHRAAPAVARIGAVLLALSGVYLIAYWLPALTGHSPSRSVAALTTGISAALTRLLDNQQAPIAALAACLLFTAAILIIRRHRASATGQQRDATTDASECCPNPAAPGPAASSQPAGRDHQPTNARPPGPPADHSPGEPMPTRTSHRSRRLLPGGLAGLAGITCTACCAIPLLLAAGILTGAGWATLNAALPGIAIALTATAGLAWWWNRRRTGRAHHCATTPGGGCSCATTPPEQDRQATSLPSRS